MEATAATARRSAFAVALRVRRQAARRPLAWLDAGAILAVGLACTLTPYLWADAWRFAGFGPYALPYVGWQLIPFALLAAAALTTRVLGRRDLLVVTAALAALHVHAVAVVQEEPFADGDPVATAAILGGLLVVCTTAAAGTLRALRLRAGEAVLGWPVAIGAVAAIAVVLGRSLPIERSDVAQTFVVVFGSIVVEALPFILLGAAVSAALEVFVPQRWFARASRLPLSLQLPMAVAAAFAFPVCECGSVPVARRLLLRGMHPSASLAFMLAAPIVNPVVLVSTFVAYSGRGGAGVVVARAALGLVVSLAVALTIGRGRTRALLRDQASPATCDVDHDHDHGRARGGRIEAFAEHVGADFLLMGRFIVAGGALSAAMQVIVPQSAFAGILASAFVGALVMIVAAFVLSLCSEADAFVAVSFAQFGLGPQLAFLAFGPILDLKLALLYANTFGRSFVLRLAVVAVPLVVATSLLAGWILR
jgi:uncharacterized membrane protein YraQ (UPF0718 family)